MLDAQIVWDHLKCGMRIWQRPLISQKENVLEAQIVFVMLVASLSCYSLVSVMWFLDSEWIRKTVCACGALRQVAEVPRQDHLKPRADFWTDKTLCGQSCQSMCSIQVVRSFLCSKTTSKQCEFSLSIRNMRSDWWSHKNSLCSCLHMETPDAVSADQRGTCGCRRSWTKNERGGGDSDQCKRGGFCAIARVRRLCSQAWG